MNVLDYSKGVEKLVDPMEVGKVHYLQTKLRKLPVWLQKKIVTGASKKGQQDAICGGAVLYVFVL